MIGNDGEGIRSEATALSFGLCLDAHANDRFRNERVLSDLPGHQRCNWIVKRRIAATDLRNEARAGLLRQTACKVPRQIKCKVTGGRD